MTARASFVPVLEWPGAEEHPEVLGVFGSFALAMDASRERAGSILELYADDCPGLKFVGYQNGLDIDDDCTMWCIRITEA